MYGRDKKKTARPDRPCRFKIKGDRQEGQQARMKRRKIGLADDK